MFTSSGEVARTFQRKVNVGMIGINVPIPVPMAFHSFGGWKDSLFGDHHIHGPEGVRFYTQAKVVTTRWPHVSEDSLAQLNFPTAHRPASQLPMAPGPRKSKEHHHMKSIKIVGAILAVGATGLAACSGTGSDNGTDTTAGNADLHLRGHHARRTRATPSGTGVKSGAEQAGKDYGVDVDYQSDADPAKQSQLIDGAVADKVDGIVVSMANPDGLEDSVKAAVAAGIPVITINSGIDQFKDVRRHHPRRPERDHRRPGGRRAAQERGPEERASA